MKTKTTRGQAPAGYDPSQFPMPAGIAFEEAAAWQKTGNVALTLDGCRARWGRPYATRTARPASHGSARAAQPKRELEVTMSISHSFDALVVAHDRGRRLRAEAAAERLRGASGTRRALAVFLHRAADRLEPAPLARRPVASPRFPVEER